MFQILWFLLRFLDKGLLLVRKLPNQAFLVVKLKSSLRKYYCSNRNVINHYRMCHRWPGKCLW